MEKKSFNDQDDTPSFGLPLENELLMMKLKAEFGAVCTTSHEEIPPVVVNEFLKSVYEFEQRFRDPRRRLTIYEKIGKPLFEKAEVLQPKQIGIALKRLMDVLHAHKLELDVLGKYEDKVIYRFMTEEFFNYEMEELDLPGYIHHFCYEEFHPNHEIDIRTRAVAFITDWFGRKTSESCSELPEQFIHPDTRIFSREEVIKKILHIFEAYTSFFNCAYTITKTDFNWRESDETGDAHVEGLVRYDAVTEGKEQVHYEAPFEFYLSNLNGWWTIYYFVFPGFSWNK